jgi:outer membrane protein OmpA-like peptidoglycan-associated protein
LPETPSRSDNEFGRAENRRVELIPTDWSILLPKVSKDTKIIKSAEVVFNIVPTVSSSLPVNSWEVNVSESGNKLNNYSGAGFPDESYQIRKSYTENSEFEDIEFSITATDSLNTSDSDSYIFDSDKVKKYLENLKIDNRQPTRKEFNLILFGYNIANIPPIAELTLDLVKENIQNDSQVLKIEGYSDIIGDDDYNLELSEQRAYRVASELNVSKDKAVGMGKVKNTEYNNDYPEGRFYSRSVIVIIGDEK